MKTILTLTHDRELPCHLQRAGYRVVSATEGQAVLSLLNRARPDLVLLDLATPGVDALVVRRGLRASSAVPFLVLASHLEEAERLVGPEDCADDFVLRPCRPDLVVARVQALLRWAERRNGASEDLIRAGDLELNLAHHRVTIAGIPLDLTRTELTLLAVMAAEPGRPFARAQLIDALTGNRAVSGRTIDSHIKNLRAKIESDPRHPRVVLTVYGVGYKLNA